MQAYAAPAHSHTPGLKIGLWGDSHTASGTFTDSLLDALRLPRAQTHPSFIAPTFGLKGVRYPLRRACLSDDWQLNMAYRTPHEGPLAYAKSLASLGTDDAGAFMWLDFRYPDAQTRVKWVDIHFSKDKAERSLVLGITVDDGAEATVNLGPGGSQRLRVQADQAFATLRLRVIAGQIRIDGFAPVYESKTQVILDVFSIPGATAKGWRVVDTAHLREQDPLGIGYDVVILQSGTNESLDPDFKAGVYEAQLNASLTRLKAAYPRARCVLIGPPDAKRSANTVRLINDSQYRLASAKGCTHWHWQKAMGGPGASVQWLAKGWMQADLLHLTPAGYEQSARSMASMVAIKGR
jgi:lysophospholipase L1-like esterase